MSFQSPNTSNLLAMLALGCCISLISAQDEPQGEKDWDKSTDVREGAAEPQIEDEAEVQLFEFNTAGFRFDIEAEYEPVIRETSDSANYAVTYQRRAKDGLAYGTDGGMAFVRFSQTVDPMRSAEAVDQLLSVTVDEAMKSIQRTYAASGDGQMILADCSQQILGKVREGKRINVALLKDGGQVYVECYAFVDQNDKGVSVILKIYEPPPGTDSVDLARIERILATLEINHITPDTPYFYSLAGYPIALPVRSRIERTRQINDFVYESNIALERGSLRVQIINVPQQYNPKMTADDQIAGYTRTLEQQNANGQLSLAWQAETSLLGGANQSGLVDGRCFVLTSNGTRYYNALYTAIDGRSVLAANFTGNLDYAGELSKSASLFFDRSMSSLNRDVSAVRYSGNQLRLPKEMVFEEMPRDPGMPADEYFVSGLDSVTSSTVLGSPIRHGGYTHIKLMYPGDQLTLEDAHRGICEREFIRYVASDAETLQQESESSQFTSADGHEFESISTLVRVPLTEKLQQELGLPTAPVMIRSYLIPAQGDQPGQVVSTIAGGVMFYDLDQITRALLPHFGLDSSSDSASVGFADIDLIAYGSFLRTSNDGSETALRLGEDSISIQSHEDDQISKLSDRLLAEQYLKSAWASIVPEDAASAYPEDSEGLSTLRIADHDALMFESQVEGDLVRMIGVQHDNHYSVITIRVPSGEPSRADELTSMFRASSS